MVRARGLAVLITATFVAFACGGTTGGGGSKGEIDIASDLPVSGADASSGLPTQQGAQFAITRAATVRGYTLKFVPFDDAVNGAHDAQKGVQNVQAMLSNSKILGMVGPFNSGVAKAEIPVGNQAPLAMISPSNTNECLTQALVGVRRANHGQRRLVADWDLSLRDTGVERPDHAQDLAVRQHRLDVLHALLGVVSPVDRVVKRNELQGVAAYRGRTGDGELRALLGRQAAGCVGARHGEVAGDVDLAL